MVDRRAGDWRNGVDLDEEMADWESTTRRGQIVVAIGLAISTIFLIAFAVSGTQLGVEFMATAMFFMAAFAAVLMLLRRRLAATVSTIDSTMRRAGGG